MAGVLAGAALYPWLSQSLARLRNARRLDVVQARLEHGISPAPLDVELSLRVARLSPLLASWETVGGCGAGSTGGAGSVKWIGRGTTGGLFDNVTQANYTHLHDGYNLVLSSEFTRDLSDQWGIGVFVPFVYKRFDDYKDLPVDVSNAGLGDINLEGIFRFGPIDATSLTLAIGLPTGTHDVTYKNDLLSQEKQLGLGRVTGTLTLDHTLDEQWGVVVLGGLLSYRGGENELGNYRAAMGSAYGYAGYFVGPLVPALGLALTGFTGRDRDRGLYQDGPLVLLSANASIEWSTDWIAVLAGISLPFGLYAKSSAPSGKMQEQSPVGLQPWTAALGVSISPF